MDSKITITEKMLLSARDYVPYEEKEAWVNETASKCFDRMLITVDDDSMPPMFKVNVGLKNRYLMAAFASLYMRVEFESDPSDATLMSVAEYDKWASGHVFNQIERWKKDLELRDKCYDLLADFKSLEKWLMSEMNGLLDVQNDAVLRQSQINTLAFKELPTLLEELKELQNKKSFSAEV